MTFATFVAFGVVVMFECLAFARLQRRHPTMACVLLGLAAVALFHLGALWERSR